eukprot:1213347-Pleurochrysis_carterae.AAC.1
MAARFHELMVEKVPRLGDLDGTTVLPFMQLLQTLSIESAALLAQAPDGHAQPKDTAAAAAASASDAQHWVAIGDAALSVLVGACGGGADIGTRTPKLEQQVMLLLLLSLLLYRESGSHSPSAHAENGRDDQSALTLLSMSAEEVPGAREQLRASQEALVTHLNQRRMPYLLLALSAKLYEHFRVRSPDGFQPMGAS